jgi:RNA polymerase sigma factor (sigma-70 family)
MATRKSKQAQGARSYKQGSEFERRVTELYRLLHYEVEHGRLFSGRQVDLFLKRRIGDIELIRAVECKSGPVGADEIDSFHAKLILVRKDFPSAMGSIVSGSTFTDAVRAHAASAGIHLILFRDLSAQLLDGHAYANGLMRELSSNERYPMDLYIEPFISRDTHGYGELGTEVIDEWLESPGWRQLTVLGDVGTGKSFLSRRVAFRLAEAFLRDPLNEPLPILIDLRNAERQFSLEGLILSHLARNGLPQVSFDVFQYALSQGQLIVILDGFDEMASRATPQVTTRNFHELSRCVRGQAKIMLTCRTHHFKSRTEEEDVILGGSQESKSENVRELYWDLISRRGFTIAYLRPFTAQQIEQYVERAKPTTTREAMSKIHQTYNLMELSQRPMLLDMIVKSIDKIGDSEINQATLYKVFTEAWIHRDQWRDVLSPADKLSFLKGFAQTLWIEDVDVIHYGSLVDCISSDLASRITTPQELAEVENEIRTASFLTRNDAGFYGFAHKSYQEYFYAQFLAEQIRQKRFECFYTRRLSPEIISFLGHLLKDGSFESDLEKVLTGPFRPLISENALATLYGMRKTALLPSAKSSVDFVIPLPDKCDLQGAQLDQIVLEGASLNNANLRGANLSEAVLNNVNFFSCDLAEATLSKATLKGARLRSVEMRNCNLKEVNLEGGDISDSSIQGADLTEAQLIGLIYDNVDFSNVVLSRTLLPDDLAADIRRARYGLVRDVISVDDTRQLDELWNRLSLLRPSLLWVARRHLLGSNVEEEDVVEDAIVGLMRDKQSLEKLSGLDEKSFGKYVRQTVKRDAVDAVRNEAKAVDLTSLQDLYDDWPTVELQAELSAEYARIKAYLDTTTDREISPDQKVLISEIAEMVATNFSEESLQIFRMYFLEGMNIVEIAEDLGETSSSISRRVRIIQEKIRTFMKN